ncbi:tryptophan-rich sensory protein [Quadrisphaera sp. KR29]|uniref:tryptophan-rich sensory protein n=1 Tax=Quadrisphaera sp. KR29 TaxID=3461391 RepID=UPI0040448C7A
MSTHAGAQGASRSARSSDTARATAVAVSAVVALVGGFLGSGAVVGTPIDQAAGGALSASATLVAPAGPAFGIWSVIYAGLLALAVFQLLPSQRHDARQRATGWWVVASLLLNAAWILVAQAGSVTGALVVITALLAVLVVAFARLRTTTATAAAGRGPGRPASGLQLLLLDGTLGLYLGWVSIATVANAAAALVAVGGLPVTGALATALAVVVLVVAAGIGWLLAVGGRGRLAPALSLAWGLAWIAVGRWSGQPEAPVVSVVAVVAAVAVLAAPLVVRARGAAPRRLTTA